MQEKVSETENDSKAMPLFTPDEAYAYLSQRPQSLFKFNTKIIIIKKEKKKD